MRSSAPSTAAAAAIAVRTPPPEVTDDDVVVLDGVTRSFGSTPALDDLSLSVPVGSITVLLGSNGAGKTTCTRVVTGALAPDHGRVRVFGADPAVAGAAVRRRIGIVSAKPALYDRLSGWDNLRYAAELYDLGRGAGTDSTIAEAADRFGIIGALDSQVGGYSTGMKTRLALARSVLHHPDLVIYDEPTSGLDPESSHAVLGLIREMTEDGSTVIMCTHLLLEAEGLADQVIMLDAGRAIVAGAPDELVRRYWPEDSVVVRTEEPFGFESLDAVPGVTGVEVTGDRSARLTIDSGARIPDVVDAMVTSGGRVSGVAAERHTLEDLYFAVQRTSAANRIGEIHDDGGTR